MNLSNHKNFIFSSICSEKKFLAKRITSLIVLSTFIISNLSPAYAGVPSTVESNAQGVSLNVPNDLSNIQIPKELGRIDSYYQGNTGQTVFLIQDAHAIPDAQRNIQQLIYFFQNEYGISLAGFEGASSELDPQIFKSFPDQATLKKTMESYFESGELSGGVAAAIFDEKDHLYHGIEDWNLFQAGSAWFLKAMEQEPALLKELSDLETQLGKQKQKTYSKKLLAIDGLIENFYNDQNQLLETLKLLAAVKAPKKDSELGLLLKETSQKNDQALTREIKNVSKKVETFLSSLPVALGKEELELFHSKNQAFQTSSLVPQEFALYLEEIVSELGLDVTLSPLFQNISSHQKQIHNIQGSQLFKEFEAYMDSVKDSLFRNDAEKRLDQSTEKLRLIKHFVQLKISRDEWESIKAIVSEQPEFTALLPYHFGFYENTQKRDAVFYKKSGELMAGNGQNAIALVVGGFHSESLIKIFKDNQISFVQIQPRIAFMPEHIRYREFMKGEVSWKNYFKTENGKVSLYDAFVRSVRDRLVKASAPEMLRQWRDQIVRDLSVQGKITNAYRYTSFLDELIGSGELKDFRSQWIDNIKQFVDSLGRLDASNQLSVDNVFKLLKPATSIPMKTGPAVLTDDLFVPDFSVKLSDMTAEPGFGFADVLTAARRSEARKLTASTTRLLDSRGNQSLAVQLNYRGETGVGYVPSGASTGEREALELRDHLFAKEILDGKRVFGINESWGDGIGVPLVSDDEAIARILPGVDLEVAVGQTKSQAAAQWLVKHSVGGTRVAQFYAEFLIEELAKAVEEGQVDLTEEGKVDAFLKSMEEKFGGNWEIKNRFGANAHLAISSAAFRLTAALQGLEPYELNQGPNPVGEVIPQANILNGGEHADNAVDIQETMIVVTHDPLSQGPYAIKTEEEAIFVGAQIFQLLKKELKKRKLNTNVGDEGGFAPNVPSNADYLRIAAETIKASPWGALYGKQIGFSLDAAFSERSYKESKDSEEIKYWLEGEVDEAGEIRPIELSDQTKIGKLHTVVYDDVVPGAEGKKVLVLTSAELTLYWQDLAKQYPLVSYEDGYDQNDMNGHERFTAYANAASKIGSAEHEALVFGIQKTLGIQTVGDDLLVTSLRQLKAAVNGEEIIFAGKTLKFKPHTVNSILVKINQVGDITSAKEVIKWALEHGITVKISHRSGETEDAIIADIAKWATTLARNPHAISGRQPQVWIKTGSFSRSDRTAKYNRLIWINKREAAKQVRSEAREITIREDAKAGELSELWGDKTVNGKTLNVEETILWLAEQLTGDVTDTINNWKEMEAEANALIDQGATPEEAFGFLAADFPATRIDGNGELITKTANQIYEGGINNFLLAMGEDVAVSPNRWAMNETVQASPRSKNKGLVLTGPSDDIGMLFSAFNATRNGVTSALEDSEDASPEMSGSKIWRQHLNLRDMYAGKFADGKFVHPTKKYSPTDPEVVSGAKKAGEPKEYNLAVGLDEARAPFHRLPGIHLTSPSVTINGKRFPAFIAIMAVYVLNNYDNLKKNGFDIGFYLPKSKWPQDMFVWNEALFLMEEAIGVPHGTIKAKVMHERAEFSRSQFVNMWVVQQSSLITNVGRWDQNSSFIQMFKRFKSMLFPDQRFAGMLTPRMTYYTLRNAFFNVLVGVTPEAAEKIDPKKEVQLVELTQALAEGGMAVQLRNMPKAGDAEEIAAAKLKNNANAISDIQIDKIRERLIGLFIYKKANGQKILLDSTRESWVATTDKEYVKAGSEPFQVELNANGSTLEEIVKPLQDYVDANVTPAMRDKFIALGILGEDGKIKPTEFTKEDLTKEKIDSSENWKRFMMPSKGERTIEGLAQEVFFTFDYNGQQVAGNNAAAVENPLDGNGWQGILDANYTGNRLMSDHATNEGNLNGLYMSLLHRQQFTKDGTFVDLTGKYPPLVVKAGDTITPNLVYEIWLRLRAFTRQRLTNFEAKGIPTNRPVAELVMETVKRILIQTHEDGKPYDDEGGTLFIQPVNVAAYFSKILYRLNELYRAGQLENANDILNAIFIKTRPQLVAAVEAAKQSGQNVQLAKLALETHDDVFNNFPQEDQPAAARSEQRERDLVAEAEAEEAGFEEELAEMQAYMDSPRFNGIKRLYTAREVMQARGLEKTDTFPDETNAKLKAQGLNFGLTNYPTAFKAAVGMWDYFQKLFAAKETNKTAGPFTGGQARIMKLFGILAIYLGGWAKSAKGGTTGQEPGADVAGYPDNAMPDDAEVIVRSLREAKRKQFFDRTRMTPEERRKTPIINYEPWIVADADTGHGGVTHVRALIRRFVEAGVPGYHIEDQKCGAKKCGHQGGKVEVSSNEQITRLNAARFQLDVMGVPGLIVGRTDAEDASLVDNDRDGVDQPFILGATNLTVPNYTLVILTMMRRFYNAGITDINGFEINPSISEHEYQRAEEWLAAQGILTGVDNAIANLKATEVSPTSMDYQKILDNAFSAAKKHVLEGWQKEARVMKFYEAISEVLRKRGVKEDVIKTWEEAAKLLPWADVKRKAREDHGIQESDVTWDQTLSQSPEGYYQVRSGIEYAIHKVLHFAPFADIVWMETKIANLKEAKEFADAIHAVYPDKLLAYNLSPSFNWDATGMTDDEMRNFAKELGKLGFVFNFITYAGHQIDGLASQEFFKDYAENGALALAHVQRDLRDTNSPYIKPQDWVGGRLEDAKLDAAYGRTAETSAMGDKSTEHQQKIVTILPPATLEKWLKEWATVNGIAEYVDLRVQLERTSARRDEMMINIFDAKNRQEKIAHMLFRVDHSRQGRKLLFIKDMHVKEALRGKRLTTIMHLFLASRYKITDVHYLEPNDHSQGVATSLKKFDLLADVSSNQHGVITGAEVNAARVEELVKNADQLTALIDKNKAARSELRSVALALAPVEVDQSIQSGDVRAVLSEFRDSGANEVQSGLIAEVETLADLVTQNLFATESAQLKGSYAIGTVFPEALNALQLPPEFIEGYVKGLEAYSISEVLRTGGEAPAEFANKLHALEIPLRNVSMDRKTVLRGAQDRVPLAFFGEVGKASVNPMFLPLIVSQLEKLKNNPEALRWLGQLTSRAQVHLADLSSAELLKGKPELLKAELLKRLNLEGYSEFISITTEGLSVRFTVDAVVASAIFAKLASEILGRSA